MRRAARAVGLRPPEPGRPLPTAHPGRRPPRLVLLQPLSELCGAAPPSQPAPLPYTHSPVSTPLLPTSPHPFTPPHPPPSPPQFNAAIDTQDGVRGVYATKDIPQFGLIAKIPLSAALWMPEELKNITQQGAHLAKEAARGDASPHAPYLNALPSLASPHHTVNYYTFPKEYLPLVDSDAIVSAGGLGGAWATAARCSSLSGAEAKGRGPAAAPAACLSHCLPHPTPSAGRHHQDDAGARGDVLVGGRGGSTGRRPPPPTAARRAPASLPPRRCRAPLTQTASSPPLNPPPPLTPYPPTRADHKEELTKAGVTLDKLKAALVTVSGGAEERGAAPGLDSGGCGAVARLDVPSKGSRKKGQLAAAGLPNTHTHTPHPPPFLPPHPPTPTPSPGHHALLRHPAQGQAPQ
jgi:hypothetical protein